MSKHVKPITARQSGELARLLEERGVDRDSLQKWLESEDIDKLVAFLKNEQYNPDIVKAILARKIMGRDFLGPEQVVKALNRRGFKIELTEEEKEQADKVPFSKRVLHLAAKKKWRGKRAILFWAPDERYKITMLKLRKLFGTSAKSQPCVYSSGWWLKEDFAQEILPSGWHLIMAEVADEFKDKDYQKQKELMTKDEKLVKPVEIMFLTLINYQISNGGKLFKNNWVRTDSLDSSGGVVSLGGFDSRGLNVYVWYPGFYCSDHGLALAWKLN